VEEERLEKEGRGRIRYERFERERGATESGRWWD
jgi:hypothetical protein